MKFRYSLRESTCSAIASSLVLVFLMGTASAEEGTAEQAKLDPAKLVGTWSYVSGSTGGEEIPKDRFDGQTVDITNKTLTLNSSAGKFVMSYKLDDSTSPTGLACEITSSPFGVGASMKGIIDLDGDQLKICYAQDGAAPKKFSSEGNENHRLLVLKRK